MAFDVEKNVPMPEERATRTLYPFRNMEVGDSFLVPQGAPQRVNAAVYQENKKRDGVKYTQRKVEGGVRVWRMS